MSNGSVDFQKSKAMPPRTEKDWVIVVVLALLPVILVAALIVTGNGRGQEAEVVAPEESSLARELSSFVEAPAGDFDYEEMAEFYEANSLLTRGDPRSNTDLDQFTVAPNAEQASAYESGAARAAAVDQAYRSLIESGSLQARDYEALQSKRGAVLPEEEYAFYTERYWNAAGK